MWELLDEENAVVDSSSSDVATGLDSQATAYHGGGLRKSGFRAGFEVADPESVHVNFHPIQSESSSLSLLWIGKIDIGNLGHLRHMVFDHKLAVL